MRDVDPFQPPQRVAPQGAKTADANSGALAAAVFVFPFWRPVPPCVRQRYPKMNPIKKPHVGCALLLGASLLAASAFAAPVTLVSQDFDHVPPQSYEDGSMANIGDADMLGQLTLATSASTTLEVADTTDGRVLKFTDAQVGGAAPNVYTSILTSVSTTATGNNRILGSFDFKPLAVESGTTPSFVFMINADGLVNSGTSSSVMITFAPTSTTLTNSDIKVSYNNGGTNNVITPTLTVGTRYRLEVNADYSRTGTSNFDSYSFTIRNLDTATLVYQSPDPINTRANADKVPNRIAFYGGASSTVANASPFFQIDKIRFIAGDSETRPFVWGVSGHPAYNSATSYWSAVPLTTTGSKIGQLNLVKELGCSYYRVDAGDPTRFAQLKTEADAQGLKLLPVIGVSVKEVILNENNGYPDVTDVYGAAYAAAYAFADTYKGQFTHVEIGNEYDNPSILGDNYSGEVSSHYSTVIFPRAKEALRGLADGLRAGEGFEPKKAKRIINAGWYHYGFIDMLIDDGVNFEVLGWHWYSGMGSMNRVMKALSSYGKPIWVTETNRTEGSQITTSIFSNDFQSDTLNAAPSGWTAAGSWQVQQRGSGSSMVRSAVNLTAAGANTLTRTFSTINDSWELEFYYDWTYGGTSAFGNYGKIIDCDMTDASDNGYRVRVRQGNSNDSANTASVLGIYKLTGGSATLLGGAKAQGAGYNKGGYANYGWVPGLKRIRFRWDSIDKTLWVDRDGVTDQLVAGDGTWNSFSKLAFRVTASSEQPLLDNISLKIFHRDEDVQTEKLGELISELWNFPQVEALFAYELLDEPNLTAFTPESCYGLCRIERDGAGQYALASTNPRKSAFTLYKSAINTFGSVPSGHGDIIVDDSYPKPAMKYSSATAWAEDDTIPGFFYRGYKHDNALNKGNAVRFYPHIPTDGTYKVYVRYPAHIGNSNAVPVVVRSPSYPSGQSFSVDQTVANREWAYIGSFQFNAWQPGNPYNSAWETEANAAYVEIQNSTSATTGKTVTADAVRLKRVGP